MEKFFGEKSSPEVRTIYESLDAKLGANDQNNLTLGTFTTYGFLNDPKQVGFRMSRYKFCGKMLAGFEHVLEVGCQEGFGTLVVAQQVKQLVALDFYKPHIEEAEKLIQPHLKNVKFHGHDIIDGPFGGFLFDAAYSLDVLEHIDPKQEQQYMANIAASLKPTGVFIIGMPSLESQQYASPISKAGHINCKTGPDLQGFCRQYYDNVFMFGMNDEVLHTGFFPMCQYLFALCVGKKS